MKAGLANQQAVERRHRLAMGNVCGYICKSAVYKLPSASQLWLVVTLYSAPQWKYQHS